MTDFNATLTRAFAEAHEPADDGFSVNVGKAVARRENAGQAMQVTQAVGLATAGVAVFYGVGSVAQGMAPEFMASAGLEFARAHGAISQTPDLASTAASWGQSLLRVASVGLTQIMVVAAALGGGAYAMRNARQ
jgi:hypothetical protein